MSSTLTADDKRDISRLIVDQEQLGPIDFMVGENDITKIEAYNEFAGPDYVLWFAVYVGQEIAWRVNGRYAVEVGYAK